jgi:hypothetical protein
VFQTFWFPFRLSISCILHASCQSRTVFMVRINFVKAWVHLSAQHVQSSLGRTMARFSGILTHFQPWPQQFLPPSEINKTGMDALSNVTNSLEMSPSWEAAIRSATKQIPYILKNPKLHYRVHKSHPLIAHVPDKSTPWCNKESTNGVLWGSIGKLKWKSWWNVRYWQSPKSNFNTISWTVYRIIVYSSYGLIQIRLYFRSTWLKIEIS